MSKVFVVDDDPTGTQSVHGVPVLAAWNVETLAEEMANDLPAAFVLANTRSLPEGAAFSRLAEIGRNLRAASELTGRAVRIISRSDSTLRGHFPAEVLAIKQAAGLNGAPILLCPFFAAGGRLTINDIHYVREGERLVPVGETEFARDRTFGYQSSNLREWVAEKSKGTMNAVSISLPEVRSGKASERLLTLPNNAVFVLNCETTEDLSLLVAAVHQAEAEGRQFLFRTAADFAAAYAGVKGSNWTPEPQHRGPGLVVVGSYVDKSTRQLSKLLAWDRVVGIEASVAALLDDRRGGEVTRCQREADDLLARGETPVLYTSRNREFAGDLQVGEQVSEALVAMVQQLQTAPRWIIAKGGITSNDIATKALGVRRAMVQGQIAPGIPVWEAGPETHWPGTPYIVFPGNVGGDFTLVEIVERLINAT